MSKKQRKPISKKKNTSSNHHVNSKYKDTLFRMIFRDKKNLLSLYNALNKTSYTNPDDMKITTLEDVIYVGMKNDVSFLFSSIKKMENKVRGSSSLRADAPFCTDQEQFRVSDSSGRKPSKIK